MKTFIEVGSPLLLMLRRINSVTSRMVGTKVFDALSALTHP